MMVPMLSYSGLNILMILLRVSVCKVDSLLRLLSVILQHSVLYSRVESMQLGYSLSLVLRRLPQLPC